MNKEIILSKEKWHDFIKVLVRKIWKTEPDSKERIKIVEDFFGMPIKEFLKYKTIKGGK